MSQSLTLYDLSAELVSLMDRYDEAEEGPCNGCAGTGRQIHYNSLMDECGHVDEVSYEDKCVECGGSGNLRNEIKRELQAFAEAHIRKVDDVRSYLRHCEQQVAAAREEQARQKQHADAWQGRYDSLKDLCKYVMQTFQAKRFDGRTGSLLLKTSGGKQAVTITDESLVPHECRMLTIQVNHATWDAFKERLEADSAMRLVLSALIASKSFTGASAPSKALIEAELQKPCPNCNGAGQSVEDNGQSELQLDTCPECGGSGRRGVSGAHLAERGEHLSIL